MASFSLDFPADFDAHEREVEVKGWYPARLTVSGRRYSLAFYAPVRLGQEIEDELRRNAGFFEPNLVVVPSVTRSNMERAVELLVQTGQIASLVHER